MAGRRDLDVRAWRARLLALAPELDAGTRHLVYDVLPGVPDDGVPALLDAARGRRAELESGDEAVRDAAAHDLATRHRGGKAVAALVMAGRGAEVLG